MGPTSYGGALRTKQGIITYVFYGFIGNDTNNAEELEGLLQGLQQAKQVGVSNLIVEGGSLIMIHMLKKIPNGLQISKISQNWRFEDHLHLLN